MGGLPSLAANINPPALVAGCDINACNVDSVCINFNLLTTFNNGSLGSCNDEERSKMRNVMRFA